VPRFYPRRAVKLKWGGTPPPIFLDLFIAKDLRFMALDLRILKNLTLRLGVIACGSGVKREGNREAWRRRRQDAARQH
jgi:hypothetical protein